MKLEERLGTNKYYVDETSPHILVDGAGFSLEEPYPDVAVVDRYKSWMDGTMVTVDEKQFWV